MKKIDPVQLTLLLFGWAALFCLPVMGMAPNRILTPKGQYLLSHLSDITFIGVLIVSALLTFVIILSCRFLNNHKSAIYIMIYVVSALCVSYLCWFSGNYAAGEVANLARVRCSFGAGFWLLILIWWLMSLEATRRLTNNTLVSCGLAVLFWLPLLFMLLQNHFQHISIFIEYRANKEAFDNAFFEHSEIVLLTLFLTITIGLWLGIMSYRHKRFGRVCLGTLSILQTVPSIALFGLLLAPLASLTKSYPLLSKIGISGIGTTPAVIALLLYSLLPMVRSTQTGLQQVNPFMLEAAAGMGMTKFQSLWKIHFRLALPVILSGLRITTVQAIGLTMVAALIGAGGFGAIMFRGLSGSAIDLVLLGVIPVVIIAALVDMTFKLLVHLTQPVPQNETGVISEGSITL